MKVSFKGNTSKDYKLRKVNNGGREDSVLTLRVAEKIRGRNNSEETIWHKVTVWRGYAETIYRLLGGNSRYIQVEGTAKPKFYTTDDGRVVPYFDVQATDIDMLDNKRPVANTAEIPLDVTAEDDQSEEVVVAAPETPEGEPCPW